MIELRHLAKRYGQRVVVQVPHLAITSGEVVGLLGNNGAGKTTLLRMLLDQIPVSEGEAVIDGHTVARSSAWKPLVASYLDDNYLLDYLTADEYLQFVGHAYGIADDEQQRRLEPLKALFTEPILGRGDYLRALSMGNRKKVGLAAALMVRPRLLVLDEPFANLDPTSQLRLRDAIRTGVTTHNMTVLLSSHDLSHIAEVCQRIVIMDEGRIVHDTPIEGRTVADLEAYFRAL
ncbi:MAG: ABC transporter ATP-binding protein [Bacteroidota bacterium]